MHSTYLISLYLTILLFYFFTQVKAAHKTLSHRKNFSQGLETL